MRRYALIGAGGTGSILARPLIHYLMTKHHGAFTLSITDGDSVETDNLARQLFRPDDVTYNKAERLVDAIHTNIPGTTHNVYARTTYLDWSNIHDIIPNGTTVLIAVDNYLVRRLIDEHSQNLRDITIINGGNERDTTSCQVHIRLDNANITPRISYMHDEIANATDEQRGPSCTQRAARGETQTIAANAMSAAWMLAALSHAEADPDRLPWHERYTDLAKGVANGPDWRTEGDGSWTT